MKVFKDQLGRKVEIEDFPNRIVSLVPSQTELLVDLGLEERIVGVTKFCVHPARLRKEKEVVGGTKQVHYEKIIALQPDLILCNKEENTEEIVLELEKIAPVHVSDIKTIEHSLELIGQYGEIFGVEENSSKIIKDILQEKAAFENFMRDKPFRRVAYFIWKEPWMVAGKNTFIDHLLQLNKFQNVFSENASRYPEVELPRLKEENVDLVLLSTEPFPFKEEHKDIFEDVVVRERVLVVDGEYFSWYGSRLQAAFKYFREFQEKLS